MFPGQCGNTAFFFKSQPDQFHFEFRGIVFPGKSFFSAHEVSTCKISGCLSYRILDSGPDGTQTTLTVQTSSNDEKLDNPETLPVHVIPKEVKPKSITRSSLGIKRLSHKKTERLKTEFIGLIDTVRPALNDSNKLTQIPSYGQHSTLFTNISSTSITKTTESVKITLDEAKLQLLLSLLNDENTAIIIPKSKVTELHEIRDLLTSE